MLGVTSAPHRSIDWATYEDLHHYAVQLQSWSKKNIITSKCGAQKRKILQNIYCEMLFFVNFGPPSHLYGWIFQPLSFNNNNNIFFRFLKSVCGWERTGPSDAQTVCKTSAWHAKGTSNSHQSQELSLVKTILSYTCTRFKTFVVCFWCM